MLSQGCPLRQEAALPQAVRSGCSHPNLLQVLLADTGNNAFMSTTQPLSVESCCCSLKSSQEQSVLSHPSKHLCASGGTNGCSDGHQGQSHQGARAPETIPYMCPSVCLIPPLALTGIIAPPQQSQRRQTLSSRCLGEGTYIKALIKRSTLPSLCSGSINWKGAKQLPSPRTKKNH